MLMTRTGNEYLQRLKDEAGMPAAQLRQKIFGYEDYFLRPIATLRAFQDPLDVKCLTDWRNRYAGAFLTEFRATEERTSRWLADTVHNDSGRILFMVENARHERLGYMGLAYINWDSSYIEADAIVRGDTTPKGMMSAALRTLLRWAKGQ